MANRIVRVRGIRIADLPFLVASGLDRERIGVQYPKGEYHRQLLIAPLRYFRASTRKISRIVVVDGRRAGYVGLNPLSRNIEYYLMPWARGGVGKQALVQYLRQVMPFEIDKHAFMLENNDRSMNVFRSCVREIGLVEGTDFEFFEYPGGRGFRVLAGTRPRV